MNTPDHIKQAVTVLFGQTDAAWAAELTRVFGRDACNQRYLPAGRGEPGTKLHALHKARDAARKAWELQAFGNDKKTPAMERALAFLAAEFQAWLAQQDGLPRMSADSLLHEDVTPDQRLYLHEFVAAVGSFVAGRSVVTDQPAWVVLLLIAMAAATALPLMLLPVIAPH